MDASLAAAVIAAQFPRLVPVRATFLGAGYDSSAFEVNDEWVFRFPERADVERQLLIEARILPVLAERSPVPLPAFRFHGQPSSQFPYHFVGYPKLQGVPAIQLDPEAVPFPQLAPVLARFLSWLHSFPVTEAARLGVEEHDIDSLIDEVRADALGDFELVGRVAPEAPLEEWHEYLRTGLDRVAPSRSTPALVHTDLAAEHILLDPATQTVTGIIDWSDIAIGNRAVDFAGLFNWGGERFVDAVLSTYQPPIDEAVRPIVRFFGACRGAADVAFGLERDRPEYVAAGIRALGLAVGDRKASPW